MKADNQLQKADFSRSAVSKAVRREVIESPGVLYPASIGTLGLLTGVLLTSSWWVWVLGIGGISAALLYFGSHYGLQREELANRYVQKLFIAMEEQRHQRTKTLKEKLDHVGSEEGKTQFERITKKFDTLKQMLSDKLIPGELTYARYLGMAEQVYLGVLDNLYDMTNVLKGINSIDVESIQQRLERLKEDNEKSDELIREQNALLERLDLHERQENKTQQFLSRNEEAMTQLDLTIAAIADMHTEDGRAQMDMESAMERLQDLANRAKEYSKT